MVGDNIGLGYAHSFQDLSNFNQFNRRLRTGDLSYFSKGGYFYIVGQRNRFVKMSGRRMNLDDIQHMISELGIENVCIGTDDLLRTERVGLSDHDEKELVN